MSVSLMIWYWKTDMSETLMAPPSRAESKFLNILFDALLLQGPGGGSLET